MSGIPAEPSIDTGDGQYSWSAGTPEKTECPFRNPD